MDTNTATSLIMQELVRAKRLHPNFPFDPIHGTAILAEESGEVVKAALQFHYEDGDIERLREELIQAGAMVYRNLQMLDTYVESREAFMEFMDEAIA